MKKTIWGNTIVKNEDRYIWFAIKSVINYLDKLIIYDTGSTDKTVEIIRLLQTEYPNKIILEEIGHVNALEFSVARQKMLENTKSDWILVLDGDEVWWENSIKKIVEKINEKGEKIDCIVSPTYNLIGDIYHYQEGLGGEYSIMDKKGHFNIRAINKTIPGLHVDLPYGSEGYFDEQNLPIQNRDQDRILFLDAPYLHFTHLQRSSLVKDDTLQRNKKRKYEIGINFPKAFLFPEVMYMKTPASVGSPWAKMSNSFKLRALLETPIKKLKRRVLKQ